MTKQTTIVVICSLTVKGDLDTVHSFFTKHVDPGQTAPQGCLAALCSLDLASMMIIKKSYIGCVMRKKVSSGICGQQWPRFVFASVQSD